LVTLATEGEVSMPAPYPREFRQSAVELARKKNAPVAQIARDLVISELCLRNVMARP